MITEAHVTERQRVLRLAQKLAPMVRQLADVMEEIGSHASIEEARHNAEKHLTHLKAEAARHLQGNEERKRSAMQVAQGEVDAHRSKSIADINAATAAAKADAAKIVEDARRQAAELIAHANETVQEARRRIVD